MISFLSTRIRRFLLTHVSRFAPYSFPSASPLFTHALRRSPCRLSIAHFDLRWLTHANPAASHLVPECASSFNCHLSWARHRIDAEKPSAGIAACSLPSSLIGASCKQAFISSALPFKLLFICLFPSACIYILPNLACCPTRSTRSPPVPFNASNLRSADSGRAWATRSIIAHPLFLTPADRYPVPQLQRLCQATASAHSGAPSAAQSARAINTDTIELISPYLLLFRQSLLRSARHRSLFERNKHWWLLP